MADEKQVPPSETVDSVTRDQKDQTGTLEQEIEKKLILREELMKIAKDHDDTAAHLDQSHKQSQLTDGRPAEIIKPAPLKEALEEQMEPLGDLCKIGETVGNRFQVRSKFREGGFGQIYKAYDQHTKLVVVLKAEKLAGATQNMEGHVLKKFQNRPHCPMLYGSGKTPLYSYTAMQLLGKNLSDLRKLCLLKPMRLSLSASIRVTYQCLEAIEAIHSIGYLHRDIKPSNFAIGSQEKLRSVVYMLDFGLCRYYLNRDGSLKIARKQSGFRGTVRYASIHAHQLMDLSRRDDLWSLFYSFYELMMGQLHWRKSNDKKIVADLKLKYSPEVMCRGLPKEVASFVSLIRRLNFEDKPNYDQMYACLKCFLKGINAKNNDLYDWQVQDCRIMYHWFRLQKKP